MSKLTEYLKSIGVPAKHITALEKADDDKDFDIAPLVTEFNASQKKLHENDPEMVADIEARTKGKILDMCTRDIKKAFGLDAAAIKDKKLEEVIALAKSESTKGLDKNLQEVQEELTAANTKLKEYEEVEIPKIKAEVENEKKAFKIDNKLRAMLPKGDDLRVPEETALLLLESKLRGTYDLDLDDEGNLVVFTKGKRLNPKSKDGTKLLTAADVITDTLKENKFIKESNADDIDPTTGKRKEIKVVKSDAELEAEKKLTSHQIAAKKHADELKAQQEAKKAAAAK